MALPSRVDGWLRHRISRVLEGALGSRRSELQRCNDLAHANKDRLGAVEDRLARLEQDLQARTSAFSAQTTVHQAWRRHPGVRAIFTRHHLPDCPSCPVGEDERLEEVAFGYGIPLEPLLAELNALLESARAPQG